MNFLLRLSLASCMEKFIYGSIMHPQNNLCCAVVEVRLLLYKLSFSPGARFTKVNGVLR